MGVADSTLPRDETNLAEGNDGSVYILYRDKLFLLSPRFNAPRKVEVPLGKDATFIGVANDRRREVWVASTDGMLIRFHNSSIVEQHHVGLGKNFPIVFDGDDELWTGSLFRILRSRLDKGSFVRYTQHNGLPEDNVYPLFVDREGNIWFGSWDNGLVKLSDKDIVRFPCKIHDAKNAVVTDASGHLWALAAGGVYEYWMDEMSAWHSVRHMLGGSAQTPLNSSHGVFAHGRLWISCTDVQCGDTAFGERDLIAPRR